MKNQTGNKIITAATVILLLIIALQSCKKKTNNITNTDCVVDVTSIKMTVNGGTFSNQTFSPKVGAACPNFYASLIDSISSINSAGITAQNANDNISIMCEFVGNTTGNYTVGKSSDLAARGTAYVQISIIQASGSIILFSDSGTMTVTEFGASGGRMSCTFSGTFKDVNGTSYNVTNGFASGRRA